MGSQDQNYINHITFVLDASSSMIGHKGNLIKVVDAQVAHLAKQSQQLDQETRVTIYTFAGGHRPGAPGEWVKCVIYDKDVLRLPSIKDFYSPYGNTALIDASLKALTDSGKIWEEYGQHAHLTFVLTDGQENVSVGRAADLVAKIKGLPDNHTVAALVPDIMGKIEAERYGFPKGNIAVWDASTAQGLEEAAEKITTATTGYMTSRATTGMRSTTNLFGGVAQVNPQTVAASGMKPLDHDKYHLIPVNENKVEIRDFVIRSGHTFRAGDNYYQLSKPEKVQANKRVAIVEKKTAKVYTGQQARDLLGLGDTEIRVKPDHNPEYDIFIQSSSNNRHLMIGTKLLLVL